MKKYVINLDRRPDRLEKFTATFTENFIRLSATDCKQLDNVCANDDDFKTKLEFLKTNGRRWVYPLRTGEIAVSYSHYRIWKEIASICLNDSEQFLIMEDDAHLGDTSFDEIYKLKCDKDFIFIGGRFIPNFILTTFQPCDIPTLFKRPEHNFTHETDRTLHAYIISGKCAKIFVQDSCDLFTIPVDYWIFQAQKRNNLIFYDRFPHICYTPDKFESNIQQEPFICL